MKMTLSILLAVCILSACAGAGVGKIATGSLTLARGSQVMIFQAVRDVLSYDAAPFRPLPDVAGITFVDPPPAARKKGSLAALAAAYSGERPVSMILAIVPDIFIENKYGPHRVFRGWRTGSARDGTVGGRPVFRQTRVPVYRTEFRHTCTRVTYRVHQFNTLGALTGVSHIESPFHETCPETTQADVRFDAVDALTSWLEGSIKAVRPSVTSGTGSAN